MFFHNELFSQTHLLLAQLAHHHHLFFFLTCCLLCLKSCKTFPVHSVLDSVFLLGYVFGHDGRVGHDPVQQLIRVGAHRLDVLSQNAPVQNRLTRQVRDRQPESATQAAIELTHQNLLRSKQMLTALNSRVVLQHSVKGVQGYF